MPDLLPFGSREYALFLVLLTFARSMDFLSTWVATPNLVLEGNPIAKWLGWKIGIPLNILLCLGFARFPLPTVIISTTSLLVAARNLQGAWLMRVMGEDLYRHWISARLAETPVGLFLFCLFAQCLLIGGIGAALIVFEGERLVPLGIGMGIVAYASAVLIFTLISMWRRRRRTTSADRIRVA